MTSIQQEAFQIIQEMPDEQLVSVIHYMRTLQPKTSNSKNHYLTDALTGIIPSDVDFDKERQELLEKKYAVVD